jgi:putative phosphoesterase
MARRQKHVDRELELGDDETATLVVVADTHSRPHRDAKERIAAHDPTFILHAGDVGALDVLEGLSEIAPCVAVRGNIDGLELPDSIGITLKKNGNALARLLLTHIAVAGPKLRKDARRLAEKHGAQMVVCGHSHVPFFSADAGLTVFNPGSIGPRRFSLPITFGVMKVSESGLTIAHVDCETGERWLPPG